MRLTASQYREVLFEKLYPGNTASREVLKETLSEVERILELDEVKRKRTLIRLDGGFGTSNLALLAGISIHRQGVFEQPGPEGR